MSNKIPFQKTFANAHDLILLLQSRGLIIEDSVKSFLKNNLVIFMHLVLSFEDVIQSRSPLRFFIPSSKIHKQSCINLYQLIFSSFHKRITEIKNEYNKISDPIISIPCIFINQAVAEVDLIVFNARTWDIEDYFII